MDAHTIGLAFMALFIASIWIILLLWVIYKVLVAILQELRLRSGSDGRIRGD